MSCPYHPDDAVCDRCPDRFDTDGRGFPHPSVRQGRQALRVCKACGKPTPLERWDLADFFHCLDCSSGVSIAPINDQNGGKFYAVSRGTVADDPVMKAARRITRALQASSEQARIQFEKAALEELRRQGALCGIDLDAEFAKSEADRDLQVAVFEAALVVGRYWGQQAGVPMAAAEALAIAVRRYDESGQL